MNFLITGGSGYIGSHLVETLRQAGHAIRVLDLAANEPPDVPSHDFVQGTIADPNVVAWAVQDAEAICHLAWGFHPEDEGREILENLLGTLNVLKAALSAKVQHVLFASSAVVYGPTGPEQVSEEHQLHPEQSAIGGAVYGLTKLACERLCLVYQRRGLPVTIFRLHGVFSQENLGQFGPMIQQAWAGKPVKVVREAGGEYVHLEDVLRAFHRVVGHPEAHGQLFNLAGTHTYRDLELARDLIKAAGTGSEVELIEDPAQGMISVSVDRLHRLLGYRPEGGEFLTPLIRQTLAQVATDSRRGGDR